MNVLDLQARLGLDTRDYESGLKGAGGKMSSFAGKLGGTLKTAAKAGAAAVAAGAAAIATIGKLAFDSYAKYEQLVGGSQLLYGDAYATVAANAKNAYSTVQMSQNDYLQQVNGFATGLKTALGGNEQAAADLAHRIIQAEADIVAATGNSQEAVQNAFNGIMKGNFTMLDNLQLGITPTKEGFQEVIDKVNQWNAEMGNATNYQMDNLADLQSALVDYVDMVGMSGYAQAEASGTIQGSLAMVKAAWENLLTGLADPSQDIAELAGNLIDGLETAAGNIIPVITKMLPKIGEAVTRLVSGIGPFLSQALHGTLPQLIAGAEGLLSGLAGTIPDLLQTAMESIPSLAEAAASIISKLGSALVEAAPALLSFAADMMTKLGDGIKKGLPNLVRRLPQIIKSIVNFLNQNLPTLLQAGFNMLSGIATGILEAIPTLVESLPEIINAMVNFVTTNLPQLVEMGIELISGIAKGVIEGIPRIVAAAPEIITALYNALIASLESIVEVGGMIWDKLSEGIDAAMGEGTSDSIEEYFAGVFNEIGIAAEKTGNTITESLTKAWEDVKPMWEDMAPYAKAVFDGLSKIFSTAPTFFSMILSKIGGDISIVIATVTGAFRFLVSVIMAMVTPFIGFFATLRDNAVHLISGIRKALSGDFEGALEDFKAIGSDWKDYFVDVKNTFIDLFSDVSDIGKDFASSFMNAAKGELSGLGGWLKDLREKLSEKELGQPTRGHNGGGGGWTPTMSNYIQPEFIQAPRNIKALPVAFGEVAETLETIRGNLGAVTEELGTSSVALSDTAVDFATAIGSSLLDSANGFTDPNSGASEAWIASINSMGEQWHTFTSGMGMDWDELATTISGKNIFGDAETALAQLVDKAAQKMDELAQVIGDGMESIKEATNFTWKLPALAMPHISVRGAFSLNPPSAPVFNVRWYKKAMDRAMLLNGATIFGAMNGSLLGGGEAGQEIVSGADTLMGMIRDAVGQVLHSAKESGVTIVQNINAVPQTPVELAAATQAYFEQARWAV